MLVRLDRNVDKRYLYLRQSYHAGVPRRLRRTGIPATRSVPSGADGFTPGKKMGAGESAQNYQRRRMKTWSLMTLHALISYIAIRMPAAKPNEISRLNVIIGS
jgi:hypothetical protein